MKKILVIEDNLEVREILEEVLELSGYEVLTAEDGTLGVSAALKSPPDLIICDVMMPKLDGYGVLNILSKKPATADIPFIFLTAKADKTDLRRGMNLGADDYITKPFYKDELLQVIETRLRKSERMKQPFDVATTGLGSFIDEAKGFKELEELSNDRTTKQIRPKESLFEEGNLPRYLYFVKAGKIKTVKTNEYGKELIVQLFHTGDFFGYAPLISGEKYSFGAIAMEASEVSLIPKEDFLKLLFANRDVSSRLIKILANNITEKEEQLLNLAYSSVRKRVANALVALHQDQPKNKGIGILRDDLARIVGTAKESVIRMLTEFKEDGLLEIKGGVIIIKELDKLATLPV